MSEEVDLIVVKDHKLAERIIKALKHGGVHHVEFWPEDILSCDMGLAGRGPAEPVTVFRRQAKEPQGAFHTRVRQEDLAQARLVLASSGLAFGAPEASI